MAFVNPYVRTGLAPVASSLAADYSGKGRLFYIAPTDTNTFYRNDAVTLTGSGDPLHGNPGITLASPSGPVLGSILAIGTQWSGGPYADPLNNNITWRPGGAQTRAYYALVLTDPNAVYEIQEGGTGRNLTNAALGFNCDLIYAPPIQGATLSGVLLNNATADTVVTRNFKLLELVQRVDNAFVTTPPGTGGGAQKWWVKINNHSWNAGVLGV